MCNSACTQRQMNSWKMTLEIISQMLKTATILLKGVFLKNSIKKNCRSLLTVKKIFLPIQRPTPQEHVFGRVIPVR